MSQSGQSRTLLADRNSNCYIAAVILIISGFVS